MESEHSNIFRVELVTKNIVLGSSGTHFMHMRVKKSQHTASQRRKTTNCTEMRVTKSGNIKF